MTDEITEYGHLFDEDATSPEYRLEALALRLSHEIADALTDRGISRSELAEKLGVSAPMVTKILSGRSNFTLKTLVTLADALDYEFEPVFRSRDRHPAVEHIQAPTLPARAMTAVSELASGGRLFATEG